MKNKILCLLLGLIPLFVACNKSEDNITPPPDPNHITFNVKDSLLVVGLIEKFGKDMPEWDPADMWTWSGFTASIDTYKKEYRITQINIITDISGYFPREIFDFEYLMRLRLQSDNLKGPIPYEIGKAKRLEYLWIGGKSMSGTIPEELFTLTSLKHLHIEGIPIVGELSPSIGNLVNLEDLLIHDTNLSGTPPIALRNLPKLRGMVLADNKFSGTFPIELLKSDVFYDVNGNNFTELPFSVWDDSQDCLIPNLQHNRLSGEVPEEVQNSERWKKHKGRVGNQQDGYGYINLRN